MRWVAREVRKLTREHQQVLRALEFQCVGLQGKIRAKNQEIALMTLRYVDHAIDPGLDNVVIVVRKHTNADKDEHHDYPCYVARLQRRTITTKRGWIREKYPDSEEIV